METENINSSRKESAGMALSGMILSFIGLICAVMANWRTIGVVIAFVGLVVSAYSLFKLKHSSSNKRNAFIGLFVSILAILVGGYFLYTTSNHDNEDAVQIPAEMHDSIQPESEHENALDKLEGITEDSTNSEH